jgi:aminoglycoside phosphotransferase (APT) family kinase protein
LEETGFTAAPRFLGLDDQGREVLSFIEGEVPSDTRAAVWKDDQLRAAADLLRNFHDATTGSEVAADGEVVCHNDFGPWNLVWRDGEPVGIIDFDNAAPGRRLDDLGYAVWKHLNLGLVELPLDEQRRRARLMSAAYGVAADGNLIAAVARAQERMRRIIEAAPRGRGREHALAQNSREREWIRVNGAGFTA